MLHNVKYFLHNVKYFLHFLKKVLDFLTFYLYIIGIVDKDLIYEKKKYA